MKYSTKSYKGIQKVGYPRGECPVLECTHPALVTPELLWLFIQKLVVHEKSMK